MKQMQSGRKRVWALALAVCLLAGAAPSAMAADGENKVDSQVQGTCESPCTGALVNVGCPVCGAAGATLEDCAAPVPAPGPGPKAGGQPATKSAGVVTDSFTLNTGTGEMVITSNEGSTAWRSNPYFGVSYDKEDVVTVKSTAGVTEIRAGAFEGCFKLTQADLPAVKTIGANAFGNCTGLQAVTLSNTVTSIEDQAFGGCPSLISLTIPRAAAPALGEQVFDGTPNVKIYVPYGATGYTAANGWPEERVVQGAPLTGLTVSQGTLDPVFSPDITSYAVSVPARVGSVTLTPSAVGGTITVDGKPVASGAASEAIALEAGRSRDIEVVVTTDGTTLRRAYTVTVAREAFPETDGGSDGGPQFWQKVREQIQQADPNTAVLVNARDYDQMPWDVMEALREHPQIALEITWRGGETIVIPMGKALGEEAGRIYYPLSHLAERYAWVESRSTSAYQPPAGGQLNPNTGRAPDAPPERGRGVLAGAAVPLALLAGAGCLRLRRRRSSPDDRA